MARKIPIAHKDYIVEMVTSIIKEMDLDLCGEHTSKDLRASSLYDLSRVCPLHLYCTSIIFLLLILTIMFCFRRWCVWRPLRIGVWLVRGWFDGFVSAWRLKTKSVLNTWRLFVPLTKSWRPRLRRLRRRPISLRKRKKQRPIWQRSWLLFVNSWRRPEPMLWQSFVFLSPSLMRVVSTTITDSRIV